MLGVYNYTVILTYIGMLAGFTGITFAAKGNIHASLICLMIAGVCDMFDGKIASTMQRTSQEKRFGIQIDSLSDLICFGVLPAMIISMHPHISTLGGIVAALYLLCALIRLAWFNVDEEERQNKCDGARKVYYGLPVTSSALIIPIVFGAGLLYQWPLGVLGPICLLIMALAFLTPFPIKKPRLIGKIGLIFLGGIELAVLLLGRKI